MALTVDQFLEKWKFGWNQIIAFSEETVENKAKMKADLEEMVKDAASKEGMRIIKSRMACEKSIRAKEDGRGL